MEQETNPTAEAPEREELTGRVLRIEGQLNGLLARLIGRAAVMKTMGAKPVLEGVLWLPIAERVDRRGVAYYLAVALKRQEEHVGLPAGGKKKLREILRFDVTYAPDADPDLADTSHFRDAGQALDDYHRIGPFWMPEG